MQVGKRNFRLCVEGAVHDLVTPRGLREELIEMRVPPEQGRGGGEFISNKIDT